MYKNNFVVVIKSKGRVLREKNGCVMLPFGTEYSILLKNLDSRRAVAKVSVDGENMINGRVIIPENSTVELKGKMRGNKVKNRFKFIEKTEQISKHRGDRPDDGLIRVEYWFEQETIQWLPPIYSIPPMPIRPYPIKRGPDPWNEPGMTTYGNSTVACNYVATSSLTASPPGDEGITVQGSKTRQNFEYGSTGTLETSSSVIVIHLRGTSVRKKKAVTRPITVKTRFRCSTCGRKSKSSAKWCSNCGTNLEM